MIKPIKEKKNFKILLKEFKKKNILKEEINELPLNEDIILFEKSLFSEDPFSQSNGISFFSSHSSLINENIIQRIIFLLIESNDEDVILSTISFFNCLIKNNELISENIILFIINLIILNNKSKEIIY